eukprot:6175567-Pleurochrysis_carterae.AAC.2
MLLPRPRDAVSVVKSTHFQTALQGALDRWFVTLRYSRRLINHKVRWNASRRRWLNMKSCCRQSAVSQYHWQDTTWCTRHTVMKI